MGVANARTLANGLASFFEPQFLGFRRVATRLDFAVHARAERRVELDLFEPGAGAAAPPFRTLDLDPDPTAPEPWMLWTAELDGLPEIFDYVLRVDGGRPLVDPYARELAGGEVWGRSDDALAAGVGRRYRGRYVESAFAWEGVERPRVDPSRRVICELHVRGFTRHASSGVAFPGTYLGLVEKIPALAKLGVTTVELLPVFEFDETENPRTNPESGARLLNFWGYSPVSFFASKAAYASRTEPGAGLDELRELVQELHRAGIELVLDVVYNHTAEWTGGGGRPEPLHSWRGLDAGAYYLATPAGEPLDYTGCGNTFRTGHPIARRMILDSLRWWAGEMGVDGFRFDLGGIFFRGDDGERLERSPIAEEIAADPLLRDRLLVAEPWDAVGFRPVAYPEPWREWDGELRDALRRLVGGFDRDGRPAARRLAGQEGLSGDRAVRFVACHDGRPLADVVAYAEKHNLANGEENRDGWDGEVAWNDGVEGPAEVATVEAQRGREIRLLWTLVAAAAGPLLFLAGDEQLRTQRGNNNAWCQDDEISWLDWDLDDHAERLRNFVRQLLSLRRETLSESRFGQIAYAEPYGSAGAPGEPAFLLVHATAESEAAWVLAVNPGSAAVRFPLPSAMRGRRWQLRLDSSRAPGQEIFTPRDAPYLAFETTHLAVAARSARILLAETLAG